MPQRRKANQADRRNEENQENKRSRLGAARETGETVGEIEKLLLECGVAQENFRGLNKDRKRKLLYEVVRCKLTQGAASESGSADAARETVAEIEEILLECGVAQDNLRGLSKDEKRKLLYKLVRHKLTHGAEAECTGSAVLAIEECRNLHKLSHGILTAIQKDTVERTRMEKQLFVHDATLQQHADGLKDIQIVLETIGEDVQKLSGENNRLREDMILGETRVNESAVALENHLNEMEERLISLESSCARQQGTATRSRISLAEERLDESLRVGSHVVDAVNARISQICSEITTVCQNLDTRVTFSCRHDQNKYFLAVPYDDSLLFAINGSKMANVKAIRSHFDIGFCWNNCNKSHGCRVYEFHGHVNTCSQVASWIRDLANKRSARLGQEVREITIDAYQQMLGDEKRLSTL